MMKMTIETVAHKQYWGYVVSCDSGTKLFHGKNGSSDKKGLHLLPFVTRAEAAQFANTLSAHMDTVLESQVFGNPRNLPGQ